ncbi:MAG: PAS domain-containing protein [Actinomycetota bacterium]|nr:PAS domain-containing protein [Actinomycetota bacterium]
MPNIELILARSLVANLSVPAFLSNEEGNFVYFNEAAEMLVGRSFEETPELTPEDLRALLDPRKEDGTPAGPADLPLPRAVDDRVPAHLHARSGRDGGKRYLATAVPMLDRDGLAIGALLFWYEDKR